VDQPADHIEAFIARWQHADGRERANYQLFLTELAALLELPRPEPAGADAGGNRNRRGSNRRRSSDGRRQAASMAE